jgi:polysaccharide export outer membrane protein
MLATPLLVPGPLSAATAALTVIHPGDQLAVQVFGEQSLSQTVTVLNDGAIEYPLVGRVGVAGKTPDQAANLLHDRLLKFVRHPVVNIAITQLAQPSVLVLGDVKTPGKYQLRSDGRVSDAIAAAGGLVDSNGAYPDARISSPQGTVSQVSLQSLLRGGQVKLDERLSEGSVVYVPGPVQFNVAVSGAVDHPGELQMNEGDRLSSAIAKAGNSANAQADLNHIHLIRTGPDGKQQQMTVNLYDALQNGKEQADVALQKGDVIYVPQARQHNNSSVVTGILYVLSRLIP